MIDSDSENEDNIHDTGENSSFSTEDWIESNILRNLKNFTKVPGVTIEYNNPQSVSEVSKLIFGNDFFNLLTSQTNLYHQQTEKSYKNYDKTLKWTDVTNHDMRKFLGSIILMRQTRKSHWKEYWSSDPLLETPIFAETMTRRQFEQIMTFLHFNDHSETLIPANRISKMSFFG